MNAQTDLQISQLSSETPWKDKKYYLWMLSPGLPVIGIGALMLYKADPKRLKLLSWIGPLLIHVIVPMLERAIGDDTSNPPEEIMNKLEKTPYYSYLVKAFIPMLGLLNYQAAKLATDKNRPFLDRLGLTVSVGVLNGVAFTTSHELSHKKGALDRFLSKLVIAPSWYTHFSVEHPFGHHKRVSTPEDPASSKMGESFYRFLPRTVIGSFKSALEIETNRLKRIGKGFWSVENELLQGWGMSAAFWSAVVSRFGVRAIPFLTIQAIYSVSLFEIINYIEHYGLMRQKREDGTYDRTMPEHSWNSNRVITNVLLYQLQRHSDHHAFPTRSFQALRHFENTPQLPSGYASMLLPAYIPALWYKMMDKRVAAHYNGDLTKANILPSKRAKILAKFGVKDTVK